MQQIPLCDTPNCTHSNDSCTAWLQIDESGFLPGVLQLGNSILLVQNGESSNHPACIWIADANGENKKLLFSAQSGQSIGPAFYTDETNSSLYFVLSEVSESSGGITEKKTLSKLDVKTAEIDPLIDITDYGLYLNSTPFVRQYDILSNKWGVLLCQKEYQTNDIRRNSREWL